MKLITKLSPKRLFRSSKKDRSEVSRSDPSSFSSGTTSSSCDDTSDTNRKPGSGGGAAEIGTPTSVLPGSGDWSDISPDIYFELVQAFNLIDKDKDGVISRSELEDLLIRLGAEPPSREEVSMVLGEVDRGGDGFIRLEDLMNQVAGSACAAEPVCGDELRGAFDVFDTDHDGKITAEELLRWFTTIGDERCTLEDCRRMIAGVDKNGDGFVCFEDFSRMMELRQR